VRRTVGQLAVAMRTERCSRQPCGSLRTFGTRPKIRVNGSASRCYGTRILAHTDLIFVDDAASTIDIAGSGSTIDDLPNVHARTQDLVERVHSIVTGKIPDYGPNS
jgi:hypothetical protein